MYKTSTRLLFCKDTYIIAEIQRVGDPERPSKLQNSSAKVSRNSRKTFAEEIKQNLFRFWGQVDKENLCLCIMQLLQEAMDTIISLGQTYTT